MFNLSVMEKKSVTKKNSPSLLGISKRVIVGSTILPPPTKKASLRGLDRKQLTTTSCTTPSIGRLVTRIGGLGLSGPDGGGRHPSLDRARYRPEVVRGSARGTCLHTRLLTDLR